MTDIAAAEKKLRQAKFFLGHLENASREMLGADSPRNPEHLEFYFSACLSAAKSIYYVLEETGGTAFSEIQKRWRSQLPEPQRSWFGKMMGLRDKDVHLGSTGAESLPKYVREDQRRREAPWGYHKPYFNSQPDVEMENPDGTKVSGPVLLGAVGLYIDQQGKRIEAAHACRVFIEQLSSLLEAMRE